LQNIGSLLHGKTYHKQRKFMTATTFPNKLSQETAFSVSGGISLFTFFLL